MNEFKFTKGKWYVSGGDKYATIQSRNMDEKIVVTHPTIATVNSTFIDIEEFRANALLIAEAGNIRQQIPFSLTELKRQRDEMLDFINRISGEMLRNDFVLDDKWYEQAKQLIKEATQILLILKNLEPTHY